MTAAEQWQRVTSGRYSAALLYASRNLTSVASRVNTTGAGLHPQTLPQDGTPPMLHEE